MAFQEYTKCVKPKDYIDLSPESTQGLIYLITMGAVFIASILALILVPAGVYVALALMVQIVIWLRWWLYGRLICLGENENTCAVIGKVGFHRSTPQKKGGDNDYSMNLFLAPRNTYEEVLDDDPNCIPEPQASLYEPHPDIVTIGRDYSTDDKYSKGIHVEFEGAGIYDLYQYAKIALAFLVVAALVPYPFSLILAVVALLTVILQFLTGLNNSIGSPVIDTPLDDDKNGSTISDSDVVVLRGEWVFDSLHKGKNEIHPIRACQIIGNLKDGTWNDMTMINPENNQTLSFGDCVDIKKIKAIWCDLLNEAEDAEEDGNDDDPENDWGIHPEIDGCRPPIIID